MDLTSDFIHHPFLATGSPVYYPISADFFIFGNTTPRHAEAQHSLSILTWAALLPVWLG